VKVLRDADDLLLPAVHRTIAQLDLRPEDSAAATLAERYAETIDDTTCNECGSHADQLKELGPKLLTALESLGATPRARAAITKGGATGAGQGKLGALRAARAAG
jgi:hypothetical protein